MDEEDLAELRESQIMTGVKEQQQRDILGDAQTGIPNKSAFHLVPLQTSPLVAESVDSSIAARIQRAPMPPLEDSPGVRVLKEMGWRPGQSAGPRVSWRTRKIQYLLAAGKSITGVDIDALDHDAEAKRHMYSSRDTVARGFQSSRTRMDRPRSCLGTH
jgi:G patch domain-containing protein 1